MKHVLWGTTIIILTLFQSISVYSSASAYRSIPDGTYQYIEERNGRKIPFLWCIAYSDDVVEIEVETVEYKTFNRCRHDGETIYWFARNKKDGSEISAVRANDELIITVSVAGSQTTTAQKIKDLPWFQPLSYSLRNFLAADQSSITFYSIRMDTNKVVKLEANKIGFEQIILDNQIKSATKVEIRATGAFSAFWYGICWYDDENGLFLKFRNGISFLNVLKGIDFVRKIES